jgi:hypothetical protein
LAAFWGVAPSGLVEVTGVSGVLTASIIRAMTVVMEAKNTSETSVNFYQTTRRDIPEGSHLQPMKYLIKSNLIPTKHFYVQNRQ